MRRLVPLLAICVFAVAAHAQTKKILLDSSDPVLLKDLQSASSKVLIVPVTERNVLEEIGDADAFIDDAYEPGAMTRGIYAAAALAFSLDRESHDRVRDFASRLT